MGTEPRSPSVEDIRWLFDEPSADGSSPNVVMEYNVPKRRKKKSGKRPQVREEAPSKNICSISGVTTRVGNSRRSVGQDRLEMSMTD